MWPLPCLECEGLNRVKLKDVEGEMMQTEVDEGHVSDDEETGHETSAKIQQKSDFESVLRFKESGFMC